MNTWRHRASLGLAFLITAMVFDSMTEGVPNTPNGMLLYHGGAGTFDLAMAVMARLFITGYLRRDVEALCYASLASNALGWALYLARTPPTLYDSLITGLNYGLAARLLMGDGDVFDIDRWRRLVWRALSWRSGVLAKGTK